MVSNCSRFENAPVFSHTFQYLTWKKKEEIFIYRISTLNRKRERERERERERDFRRASCVKRDDRGSYLQYVCTRVRPIKTPFEGREERYDELLHIKWPPKCSWQRISGTKKVLRNVTPHRATFHNGQKMFPVIKPLLAYLLLSFLSLSLSLFLSAFGM